MIALKLPLYLNMVNFRRENSFGHIQSYPLPTPSMVRGMAHELLGLKEYKPLKISIQGDFDSVNVNMQRVIKFDRDPKSRPDNPYRIVVGKSQKTATHSIAFVDSLVNCSLLLHITFDDEDLTKQLYKETLTKTVVLGRNEDIARVDFDNTSLTSIAKSSNEIRLPRSVFVNIEDSKRLELNGTSYRLPFRYQNVNSFAGNRIFHRVDCKYVAKNTIINDATAESYDIDQDGNFVSFLSA